ncbi:MAG: DUF362 domain-containing protein [Planctomycetota bacterium]
MNSHKPFHLSRRSFVKHAALGTAALGLGPSIFLPGKAKAETLEEGFIYHPTMNPLRVVTLKDPAMTTEDNPTAPWNKQDELVDVKVVGENIDRLACTLSEEKEPKQAWKKLLLKPAGKAWNEIVVAIKTNNIALQHTKSGVMAKVCRVLTQELGVKASNIFIYDACHGGDMVQKTPFKGLPEGCNIASTWGGFAVAVPVGKPWKDGEQKVECVESLAKGKVDILINIALCKGHSSSFGTLTMCMKNHMGTFNPRPHAHSDGATDFLFAINRSPLILGDLDETKKRIALPRQQLCLVDALWASEKGPQHPSSVQPNRLFMGTFGPAVDYLAAVEFREKEMGWQINRSVVDRFLTDFGFNPSDLLNKGKLIEA